ncbi:MAG: GNAT family N-acetyltransferase [Victivallaceae bacterium]
MKAMWRKCMPAIDSFGRLIERSRSWFRPEEFFVLLIEPRHGAGELAYPVAAVDAAAVERGCRRGRLSSHEARILLHYLKTGSRVLGIVDDDGLLQAWSVISHDRDFSKSDIFIPAGQLGYIHDTQVSRLFRGKGRGEAINRAVARTLGQDEKLLTLVRSSNRAALKAWKKCGASPILRINSRRSLLNCWYGK